MNIEITDVRLKLIALLLLSILIFNNKISQNDRNIIRNYSYDIKKGTVEKLEEETTKSLPFFKRGRELDNDRFAQKGERKD